MNTKVSGSPYVQEGQFIFFQLSIWSLDLSHIIFNMTTTCTCSLQSLTPELPDVHVGLLLVPEERVEEGVDEVGVRHLVGALEQRVEELHDLLAPPVRHFADLLPAQTESGPAQTATRNVASGIRTHSKLSLSIEDISEDGAIARFSLIKVL